MSIQNIFPEAAAMEHGPGDGHGGGLNDAVEIDTICESRPRGPDGMQLTATMFPRGRGLPGPRR